MKYSIFRENFASPTDERKNITCFTNICGYKRQLNMWLRIFGPKMQAGRGAALNGLVSVRGRNAQCVIELEKGRRTSFVFYADFKNYVVNIFTLTEKIYN